MSLLVVDSIKKYFPLKSGFGKPQNWVKAVDGVSFKVNKDSVFAVVGESGCGKSTVARLILKLLSFTDGRIFFKGEDILSIKGEELKKFRRSVQIVFQDPFASLNPRMRVVDTLSEPFKIHRIAAKHQIKDRVAGLLEKVGLSADALNKYPHEFSGGQRQRICIARALTVSPELIVADEPLSALDVSIQAQILNLLQDIKKETAISIVFISHDLKVVHYLSDEVAVMYLGKIVEIGETEELFKSPKHPYTKLLLASAPVLRHRGTEKGRKRETGKQGNGETEKRRNGDSKLHPFADSPIHPFTYSFHPIHRFTTDVPSPITIPNGCPFHPRCPERMDICDKTVPELKETGGGLTACHLY